MEIKYISNASIFLKTKNTKVLFDPWITFDNISESNYYNFPENKYKKKDIASLSPDYIYISHSHPDHFDETTLNLFDKKTPIIIANFKNPFLKRNLQQIGFKNILVSDNNLIKLNSNDFCYLEPSETTPELDSVSFFQLDNYKILNLNDNIANFKQSERIANKFKNIDLAFLPYSGFGAYPMSYDNLNKRQKIIAHNKKIIQSHENFIKYIQKIKPNYVIPFAGEVLMGGSKTKFYNYGSGIGTKTKCVTFAKKKLNFNYVLMSPKCSFDFKNKIFKGKFVDNYFNKHPKYLNKIGKKKNNFTKNKDFHITKNYEIDLTKSLEKALTNLNSSRLKRELKIPKKLVYIDIFEKSWLYKLNMKTNKVIKHKKNIYLGKEYEIFKMDYSMLVALLTRHVVWTNIEEDIHYFRKPNTYDENLHFLMNFLAL